MTYLTSQPAPSPAFVRVRGLRYWHRIDTTSAYVAREPDGTAWDDIVTVCGAPIVMGAHVQTAEVVADGVAADGSEACPECKRADGVK